MISVSEPDQLALLRIDNNHVEDCGDPPNLSLDHGQFVQYFMNTFGEQWVLIVAKDKQSAVLRGGDSGWEKTYEMKAPLWLPEGLVLGTDERLWLLSCVMALDHNAGQKMIERWFAGEIEVLPGYPDQTFLTAMKSLLEARKVTTKGKPGKPEKDKGEARFNDK